MKKLTQKLAFISLLIAGSIYSQAVLDGVYVKENTPKRNAISYTPLREADVIWSKRVWRIIDLREKMNQPFYYPEMANSGRQSLFDLIKTAIYNGQLTTFSVQRDDFAIPLTFSESKDIISKTEMRLVQNLNDPNLFDTTWIPVEVESREVIQYLVKEDWFFDKQRGVMEVRILGICPLKQALSDDGEFKGYKQLFWIYFPEARKVFANAEVFNRRNDEERRTYEDIFWKRQFSSFIYKESNVYDRSIPEVKGQGFILDGLLEAEKIKNSISNWEHDLWHF